MKKYYLPRVAVFMLLLIALTLFLPIGWGMPIAEAGEGEITLVLKVGEVTMTVNGAAKPISAPPELTEGRVFVPFRAIAEGLGGTVGYDAAEKKVTITLGSNTINLWLGKNSALVNGQNITLDAVPYISNGSTMVPLRFVTTNLGCYVQWDGATQLVNITGGSSSQPATGQTPSGQQNPELTQETSFSNDVLQHSMEATDSYRRKIKTVSIDVETGKPVETYEEFAYIRKPYAEHMLLDFVTSGSYSEDILIVDTTWMRSTKGGQWEKFLAGNWFRDPAPSYKYDLSTQFYPINYGKLKFQPVGTEQVNGINCIKYTVSGSYEDEFNLYVSPEKYPIKLSATGTIWIADDPVIKQALIRQRITVNTDIESALKDAQGNPVHAISNDVIEDDVMDVNSTVIQPPTD